MRDYLGPDPLFGKEFSLMFRLSRQRFHLMMEDVMAKGVKFYQQQQQQQRQYNVNLKAEPEPTDEEHPEAVVRAVTRRERWATLNETEEHLDRFGSRN
jgi:hypothetical protein